MAALVAADPPPQLLTPPTPVSRRASAGNRGGLQVAAYDPSADPLKQDAPLYRERSVVPAPEYDDEHPDELSYRPFPIAPFLTATASADDPALSGMVHPNLAKIIETLDQDNVAPPHAVASGSACGRAHVGAAVQGRGRRPFGLLDADCDACGRPQPQGCDAAAVAGSSEAQRRQDRTCIAGWVVASARSP